MCLLHVMDILRHGCHLVQVSAAIQCLENAIANPIEHLSESYRQGELSEAAKAELSALPHSQRADLLQELRRFLNAYLVDFRTPYPADTLLADFWRHEERTWLNALDRADIKLSSLGTAFVTLMELEKNG